MDHHPARISVEWLRLACIQSRLPTITCCNPGWQILRQQDGALVGAFESAVWK